MPGFNHHTYYSDMVGHPTCVYRCWDADENLLYVGMSMNLPGRISKHRHMKPWWPSVTRISVEWFKGREPAKAAERAAIRDERPLHNVAGVMR